ESLTQEVAYEGLLLKQRRQLHERIGSLLEGDGGASAERSALLAHHYVRSDNREKAVEALLRAAREAEQVPSYRAAARFYREAWELAETGFGRNAERQLERVAVEAAIGLSRMRVIYNVPDTGDDERLMLRGRELAASLGDKQSEAGLCTFLGM